jgi:hypothetical protein
MRTARTLEAECGTFCGEAWVRAQRKLSQVLGAFGLLGARFETYEQFISLIFNFFPGRGKPRILNQSIRRHDCTCIRNFVKVKVKVKFTLEQATKAQRGSRGIALPFL